MNKACLVLLFFVGLFSAISVSYAQEITCATQTDMPSDLVEYAGSLFVQDRLAQQDRFLLNPFDSDTHTPAHIPVNYRDYENQGILLQYVAISPNGKRVLIDLYSSIEDARFAKVIEFDSDQEVTLSAEMFAGIDVAFMRWASSNTVAVYHQSGSPTEFQFELVNINTQNQTSVHINLKHQRAQYKPIVFSPDTNIFATTTTAPRYSPFVVDQIELYDVNSGGRITSFATDDLDSIYHLSWSPVANELLVVTIGREKYIRVLSWDREDFDTVVSLDVEWAYNIQWSPDGHFFLYRDGNEGYPTNAPIKIVNIQENTIISPCIEGDAYWSPDSKYVAIFVRTDPDGFDELPSIYIFDVTSGELYSIEDSSIDLHGILRIIGWANVAR